MCRKRGFGKRGNRLVPIQKLSTDIGRGRRSFPKGYLSKINSNSVKMRVLIQRVKTASVTIDNEVFSKIDQGLLVLLGIEEADTQEDINWLTAKISKLRIFSDEAGAMNLSVKDVDGECLVVSQFTLHANTKKGNRPSFIKAARPETAIPLYENFIERLEKELEKEVQTGSFGAMMDITLVNDGPVTIWMDTKNKE